MLGIAGRLTCCLGTLALVERLSRNRHVGLTEKGEKAGGGVP